MTAMRRCWTAHFNRWVMGSLMIIWLLLGSLALAEQLNIVSETGSHDEQALTDLQLAVKSETLDASLEATLPDLLTPSITLHLHTTLAVVVQNAINVFTDSPHTRSLSQFTCCYRI